MSGNNYFITTTTTDYSNLDWLNDNGIWRARYSLHPDTDFLKPTRVIYNPPYTICYFSDGSKEIAKCMEGDAFVKDVGVMVCVMHKIFRNKSEFHRIVESGYMQPPKE